MSHHRIIGAPLLAALLGAALAQAGFAAEPVKVVVLEPGQGELVSLLEREVTNAAAQHRVPFLQITAEWCVPCKKLRASLGDPLMQDAFAGTYIIRVDADAWKAELKKAGFDHPAIPVFFAVDSTARPTGAKIDGGAWGEDIPPNMAPPLKRFFGDQIAAAAQRH
jgi:thiol:disulfide interchange protein